MTSKAYITSRGMITFICPECRFPRVVKVQAHKGLADAERVRVTCSRCGHKYRVVIERRRQFRKAVDFAGSYRQTDSDSGYQSGFMRVLDLSRTGLRLRIHEKAAFEPGDILEIEFHLDDANRSLIRKEVEIKTIEERDLGVAFCSMHPSNASDRALGFYMLG
jgi:ribosomal protein S14